MIIKKTQKKKSLYGQQLAEKQELKKIYGLREAQFRKVVDEARRLPGNPGSNLLILLERRLDNIIFRLGFAQTRAQARQYTTHGLFILNGKKVDVPSILLNPGDKISPKKPAMFDSENLTSSVPWLSLDKKSMQGEVKKMPQRQDIDTPINESIIIEFYSR